MLNNSAWLWVQQVADMLLAFGFAWLAMRRLGPAGFGALNLTQAVLNIAGLATLNLELTIVRFIPEFRQAECWRTMRLTLAGLATTKAVLAGLAVVGLALAAPALAQFYHQPGLTLALRLGGLSLFSAAMADVGAAICLSLNHPEVRAALTTLRRVVEIAGLTLVTLLGGGLAHVVAVLALADTTAALGYGLAARRYLRQDPQASSEAVDKSRLFKRLLDYTLPLIGARLTEISGREIGRLFLGRLASAEVLGFYSVARLAAERLMALLSQAPLAALPVLSAHCRGEDLNASAAHPLGRPILRLVNYQLIAASLLGLALAVLAPLFALIVGGEVYQATIPTLRAVILTVVIWAGVASLHTLFLAGERPAGIFYLNLIYIGVTLLAYPILTPLAQAVGAALADGVGQIGSLLLAFWLGKRWFGLDWRQAGRSALRIAIPVALLTLPAIALSSSIQTTPAHLWLTALLLAGLLGVYGTYLLRLDFFDEAAWGMLERIVLHPRLPRQAAPRLINWARAYQTWLKTHLVLPAR